MVTDEYGEIINCQANYMEIAIGLDRGESQIIGWTDGNGTHLDILFTFSAERHGSQLQRGIEPTDLFVSIMSVGSFGFDITWESEPEYYREKLSSRGILGGKTGDEIAKLINGVRTELLKL